LIRASRRKSRIANNQIANNLEVAREFVNVALGARMGGYEPRLARVDPIGAPGHQVALF
jgi:hypothetical protein